MSELSIFALPRCILEAMNEIKQHIEALIFSAEQVISLRDLQNCLHTLFGISYAEKELLSIVEELQEKYKEDQYVFEIVNFAEGYQVLTKPKYHHTVSTLIAQKARKRLSLPALETLSIIAYKQPVSRFEIEQIRGVNCDYAIQKLLEKELIVVAGRSDSVGKPLLYGTSSTFMEHFGIRTLAELPKLKEFEHIENEIGLPQDLEEEAQTEEAELEKIDLDGEESTQL